MKKFIAILIVVMMALGTAGAAVGCGKKADFTVGIVQLVQHAALDQSNEGFRTELTRLMTQAGKTVEYNNQNANNEQANCSTIAETFVARNTDLILAIATPAAQATATKTQEKKIPVLFTAVTDAVGAHLVASNDAPGANVTGVSDINPVDKQIRLAQLLAQANPKSGVDQSKIGFMYFTSEPNSAIQLDLARATATEIGVTIEEQGVNDINNIQADFAALVNKGVAAIYIPTDNTLANAAETIRQENAKTFAKLPIVCGENNMTEKTGGVATYGIDYLELGKMAARMAYEILINGKDPATMPVQSLADSAPFTLYESNADAIGFVIPDSVRELAA